MEDFSDDVVLAVSSITENFDQTNINKIKF